MSYAVVSSEMTGSVLNQTGKATDNVRPGDETASSCSYSYSYSYSCSSFPASLSSAASKSKSKRKSKSMMKRIGNGLARTRWADFVNRFDQTGEKMKYGLDMRAPSVRPHIRRSRCLGGENRRLYLRLGSHSRTVGISSTDAAPTPQTRPPGHRPPSDPQCDLVCAQGGNPLALVAVGFPTLEDGLSPLPRVDARSHVGRDQRCLTHLRPVGRGSKSSTQCRRLG